MREDYHTIKENARDALLDGRLRLDGDSFSVSQAQRKELTRNYVKCPDKIAVLAALIVGVINLDTVINEFMDPRFNPYKHKMTMDHIIYINAAEVYYYIKII